MNALILSVTLSRFATYAFSAAPPPLSCFRGLRHFTYGRQNGNSSTWLAWAAINLIPMPIVHLILHQQSALAAGLTTLATLACSLWMFAEARAARMLPVSIDAGFVYLRYGLSIERRISISNIQAVKKIDWMEAELAGVTRYKGFGAANLSLHLESGETVQLGLDDPTAFVAAVTAVLEKTSSIEPEYALPLGA